MAAPFGATYVYPKRWCLHQDKALVVNFNRLGEYNSVQQIKLLHAAYRPLFSRVLFTGVAGSNPHAELQEHINQGRLYRCDSYEAGMTAQPGFMSYICAAGALAMDSWSSGLQGPHGMFYMNDDVVFSPCMVSGFNSSNIWYTSTFNEEDCTIPASARTGWNWPLKHSVLNRTLSELLQEAYERSYGLMAQRRAMYMRNGTDSFNYGQADVYYLPARYHKEYIAMAAQMRAQYVISEAAVPNMLGLLKTQPADIEPFSFAWAWSHLANRDERGCLSQQHTALMPSGSSLDAAVIQKCVKSYVYTKQLHHQEGFFALHPVKFSDAQIAQHWLNWWASQSC
jgi:hypothetical protein